MDPRIANIIEQTSLDNDISWRDWGMFPEWIPTLEAMARQPEIEVVWKAITSRVDMSWKRHMQSLLGSGLSQEDAEGYAKTSFETLVGTLVGYVHETLHHEQFIDSAVKSERAKLLKTVEKAVAQLQQAIDAISYEHGGERHWHLDTHQRAFALKCAHDTLAQALPDYPDPSRILDSSICSIAAQAAATHPAAYLGTILQTFKDWAAVSPLVPAPNARNADRLRLIRELTGHFRTKYGTPLRRQVLIITSAFFDCDGLTEAEITKLAP